MLIIELDIIRVIDLRDTDSSLPGFLYIVIAIMI